MIPPKIIKFRDFKRIFRSFDVQINQGKYRGHKRNPHFIMEDSEGNKFPIPGFSDRDDVERCYVQAARRKFKLATEDGITNKDFYGRI